MNTNAQRIYEEAQSLPEGAKIDLAEKLIGDIELNIDPQIQKAHIKKAIRRRDEIRDGKVKLVKVEVVLKCVEDFVS